MLNPILDRIVDNLKRGRRITSVTNDVKNSMAIVIETSDGDRTSHQIKGVDRAQFIELWRHAKGFMRFAMDDIQDLKSL